MTFGTRVRMSQEKPFSDIDRAGGECDMSWVSEPTVKNLSPQNCLNFEKLSKNWPKMVFSIQRSTMIQS